MTAAIASGLLTGRLARCATQVLVEAHPARRCRLRPRAAGRRDARTSTRPMVTWTFRSGCAARSIVARSDRVGACSPQRAPRRHRTLQIGGDRGGELADQRGAPRRRRFSAQPWMQRALQRASSLGPASCEARTGLVVERAMSAYCSARAADDMPVVRHRLRMRAPASSIRDRRCGSERWIGGVARQAGRQIERDARPASGARRRACGPLAPRRHLRPDCTSARGSVGITSASGSSATCLERSTAAPVSDRFARLTIRTARRLEQRRAARGRTAATAPKLLSTRLVEEVGHARASSR